MRIISRKKLREFWERHPDTEQPLKTWYSEIEKECFKNTSDIKRKYGGAKILTAERVVFKIKGNKYRLIVSIDYEHSIVYVRFIGTHDDYNSVDAKEV